VAVQALKKMRINKEHMITEQTETTSGSLLRLLPSSPEQESERLPILTTAADIRELVQYLKRRPAGVIAAEELDRPKKRLFEDRKLEAYEFLGITTREAQTLRLTPLGWKFARRMEADTDVFRYLLDRHRPYTAALNWISQQNMDMITSTELCNFWHGAHSEAFGYNDQETIRGAVLSFFSISQAAGLGTLTLGKRGHITRFVFDRDELARFLAEKSASTLHCDDTTGSEARNIFIGPVAPNDFPVALTNESQESTVLIQCKNPKVVELIQRTLEIINVRSRLVDVVWNRNGSTASALDSSREVCALIAVLGEESFIKDQVGNSVIKDSVLMELGAAHVLYDRRVVLMADSNSAGCEGIEDLIRYEFDDGRLDWEVGLQLITLVNIFREKLQPLPTASSISTAQECRA
jgi:hypothetical protein